MSSRTISALHPSQAHKASGAVPKPPISASECLRSTTPHRNRSRAPARRETGRRFERPRDRRSRRAPPPPPPAETDPVPTAGARVVERAVRFRRPPRRTEWPPLGNGPPQGALSLAPALGLACADNAVGRGASRRAPLGASPIARSGK